MAEDEEDIQFLYETWLVREGFDVVVAGDGEAAMEALDRTEFDCVVLDVMMPKIDGLEVCRRIRASGRTDMPVIMVSALARPSDVTAGLDAGADVYIDKPITPREVVDRIRALLAERG